MKYNYDYDMMKIKQKGYARQKDGKNMAYETKVIIIGMAAFARKAKNKEMYNYAAELARAENLILTPYEDESYDDTENMNVNN